MNEEKKESPVGVFVFFAIILLLLISVSTCSYYSTGDQFYKQMISNNTMASEINSINYQKGKEFIDYAFSEAEQNRGVVGYSNITSTSNSFGLATLSRSSLSEYGGFKLYANEFSYKGVKLIPKDQITYARIFHYWKNKTKDTIKKLSKHEEYTGHFGGTSD